MLTSCVVESSKSINNEVSADSVAVVSGEPTSSVALGFFFFLLFFSFFSLMPPSLLFFLAFYSWKEKSLIKSLSNNSIVIVFFLIEKIIMFLWVSGKMLPKKKATRKKPPKKNATGKIPPKKNKRLSILFLFSLLRITKISNNWKSTLKWINFNSNYYQFLTEVGYRKKVDL